LHTLLFVLAVLAIIPLAALLSHATESVAAKTGDSIGGLLNATLGNHVLSALKAGQYMLVKASIAGAIVTYALGMLFSLKTHREAFPAHGPKATTTTANQGRSASRWWCSLASPCWWHSSVKSSSAPCSTPPFHSA
jgi:calcium/proton exchanger cax